MRIGTLSIIFCGLLAVLGVTSVVAPSQLRMKAGMLKSVLTGPISQMPKRWKTFAEFLDKNLAEHVIGHEPFIELNGACQKIQGKDLVQDSGLVAIYRQPETGNLLIPEKKVAELPKIVENLCRLHDNLARQKIPLLVCIIPDKPSLPDATFPEGYDFYARENLDSFIALAQAKELDCLDLRDKINTSSQFFKTDHHLKSTTAFVVAKDIVDWLRRNNVIDADMSFDPVREHYDEWLTPCRFIGSWGKRVGEIWSGDDDFVLMVPKFNNSFTVDMKALRSSVMHREGDFKHSILDLSVIESTDKYDNRWGVVLGHYDWEMVRIHNNNKHSTGKVMFIEDSFGLGTMPYVVPTVNELVMIDLRSFKDMTVTRFIAEEKPNAVVVVYNSQQLVLNNMFNF